MLDKDNTCSHRLVGKFFTNSTPPSFEETEQSLRQQWKLSGDDMTVQKLDDTFLFEFRQEKDKKEVLDDLPYNVNGVILVIKDPSSSDMIDFTVATIHVLVVGLPFYLFTQKFLPDLKSLVGDNNPILIGIHHKNLLLRFQVEVDLKKPLRPGFYSSQNRFVEFKYLNLGDFCYNCGKIGHVKENCEQVKSSKKRDLNSTSRTHIYGPWLRLRTAEICCETVLMKSHNGAGECENTLSYPQFFIEIEFNSVYDYNPRSETKTESTHRFRLPCSYLDTGTDSTITDSKAYEVIRREIYENTPSSFGEAEINIGSIVEELKIKKKNEFCSDDKWLTLKLQINRRFILTPVDYETMLWSSHDKKCLLLITSKIKDLIKRRMEENTNLLCLSSWESQIRELLWAFGYTHQMHLLNVSRIAYMAMLEAVRMEISSLSCPVPADRSKVSKLKRYKVSGSDMDKLDSRMICVGEMFLGEEVTVLPCSHVFHSSCIENWLQIGHKCPLCGFKLPTQK